MDFGLLTRISWFLIEIYTFELWRLVTQISNISAAAANKLKSIKFLVIFFSRVREILRIENNRNQCAVASTSSSNKFYVCSESLTFFRIFHFAFQTSPQSKYLFIPNKNRFKLIEILITFIFYPFFHRKNLLFPHRRFIIHAGCYVHVCAYVFVNAVNKYSMILFSSITIGLILMFCFFFISTKI